MAKGGDKSEIHYRIVRRFQAYYEVSIAKGPEKEKQYNPTTPFMALNLFYDNPCIAVGLASNLFPSTGYQPGWVQRKLSYM
jgi:hypothetical protein